MKEWGGYLPFDSRGNEYFNKVINISEDCIFRVNAARYAIAYIVKCKSYKRVWIPYYICKTVFDVLKSQEIECIPYNIDEQLEPTVDKIFDDDVIIITNYFGVKENSFVARMAEKYHNVIFDNTQSFYCLPIMRDGAFNIYSPRKFFGVSDGAYIISNERFDRCLINDISTSRLSFLFGALESGTNKYYRRYLLAEESITDVGIKGMSKTTKAILGNIDYETIIEIRRHNFDILRNIIPEELQLPYLRTSIKTDCMNCPMVFPMFVENDYLAFREYLIENKVYVSQWWKWVLEMDGINEIERKLCTSLFPIPIDQRYNEDDMKNLAYIIMAFFEEKSVCN